LANVGAAWQKFCEDKSVNITARSATEPFKKLRTKKRTNSNSNLLFVSWLKFLSQKTRPEFLPAAF
jgi:hypothetical protein